MYIRAIAVFDLCALATIFAASLRLGGLNLTDAYAIVFYQVVSLVFYADQLNLSETTERKSGKFLIPSFKKHRCAIVKELDKRRLDMRLDRIL